MNIGPSQSTLHALGNPLSQTAPTAQTKVPVDVQTAAAPAANSTQRADAAPRVEAPVRPEAITSSEPKEGSRPAPSYQDGHRAAKIDILV